MPKKKVVYEPSNPRGKWATRRDLSEHISRKMVADKRMSQTARDIVGEDVMTEALEAFGLDYEFKILRLVEKVKVSMMKGAFGPIYIPNTTDQDGQRIATPVGQIALMLKDIYTPEFLAMFDEEGEPLPEVTL